MKDDSSDKTVVCRNRRARRDYRIEDTLVLRDLLRASLHRTHLHIYNEVKEQFAGNILSAVLSSYRYALSMYAVSHSLTLSLSHSLIL